MVANNHIEKNNNTTTGSMNGTMPASVSQNASFKVESPDVHYTEDAITTKYIYKKTIVETKPNGAMVARPADVQYEFKVDRKVGKLGLMLVGWGGNNGSTLTASILANKHNLSWETREGVQHPNYFGSVVLASTLKLGVDAGSGRDVYIPFSSILPMADPNELVLGGWDISSMNLADAMDRAAVLEPTLKSQVRPMMASMKPLPSVYFPDFIAANQEQRADNVLSGTKQEQLDKVRADIRDFKSANNLDRVIVLWTANTERFANIENGVNDTADNLLRSIRDGHEEVSPSTLFAVACVLEKVPFINGSPQNTMVPGVIELASQRPGSFLGGDDFKSGQTKMKSALVDFLINAGLKPTAITSYNHLGNNDGKNLSEDRQFRSKEISKSNVVDDMVAANRILYPKPASKPDHCVVIKYIPSVGDSKRALDEYVCSIFMNGKQTISMHNTCEDSLLASPLILDLTILADLMTRITYRTEGSGDEWRSFEPVLNILSYMLKAPLVNPGAPVVNALAKQRACMENVFRACIGLEPNSEMGLEWMTN